MIQLLNKEWKVVDPTPYHFLLLTDYIQSAATLPKLKTETFAGVYLIYLCLENDTGAVLADVLSFENFLKQMSFRDLGGLKEHMERFQDFLEDLE